MTDALVETTRERIARVLRDLAAEDQPSVIGKTVQMVWAAGMGGALIEALPEDDAAADAQLEYLAGIVLALRSPAALARNPFEPYFGTPVDAPAPSTALELDESEVASVFASLGLGAIDLADLRQLAGELETQGLAEWAGVTVEALRAEIARREAEPDPAVFTDE